MNVPIEISLMRGAGQVDAHATLTVVDSEFEAKATAPLAQGDEGWIGEKLAVARALRALEVEVMAVVHERINRTMTDA
jgi:hypothetical protein